jgi:hypothetical protein
MAAGFPAPRPAAEESFSCTTYGVVLDQGPASMDLALDIGSDRLELRVQRIEIRIESLLG